MTWSTIAARAVNAGFRSFGQPATYTPAGGDPIVVTVIVSRPTETVGFGEAGFRGPAIVADLRAAEVASPGRGDALTISGTDYTVFAHPSADPEGLVHRLELRLA